MMNLLLDEHMPRIYIQELKRKIRGLEIRHIGDTDAPPLGTKDPEILNWCETNQYMLLTNDRNTIPSYVKDHVANGKHLAGVLLLKKGATLAAVLEDVVLIADDARDNEFLDSIVWLPL